MFMSITPIFKQLTLITLPRKFKHLAYFGAAHCDMINDGIKRKSHGDLPYMVLVHLLL